MRLALKLLLLFGLLLAGLCALTLWRAARHEARAEASHPPQGQFIDVNGTRVHAVVMGQGPDVVLIHGASGNTRDMTFRLAPALARRYRVIVFDRPGLGYTERLSGGPASITDQARLLAAAAAQLGAPKPIVVGQSYGGAVALAWAVHEPGNLSALVTLAAASNPWTTPLDRFYRITSSWWGNLFAVPVMTAFVSDTRVSETLNGVFAPQSAPEGYAAHFGPGLSLRRATLRANTAQRVNLLGEISALSPRYGEIAVPTEILHGTADTTVNFDIHSSLLVDQIPGARLTPLEGIGHMPQHVAVPQVVAAVDRAASRAGLR